MYNTILVPLDSSRRAEKILPHVEAIAQKFGAKLVLLQVIEPIAAEISPSRIAPHYDKTLVMRWHEEAKVYLAGVQGELQAKGIATKTVIETGPVLPSLFLVAARENVDLIALASHGRTGLARAFYGSVAAGLLNQTNWPLLLVSARD
jgi:nucleotide-binding universal stress UspA family protein